MPNYPAMVLAMDHCTRDSLQLICLSFFLTAIFCATGSDTLVLENRDGLPEGAVYYRLQFLDHLLFTNGEASNELLTYATTVAGQDLNTMRLTDLCRVEFVQDFIDYKLFVRECKRSSLKPILEYSHTGGCQCHKVSQATHAR